MIEIIRTDSDNSDFQKLVSLLDYDLKVRDGDDNAFYSQFNKIDQIKNSIVAYQNTKAIACGAFKPFSKETVEIKRMFVLPEYRGQKIAHRVLEELEKWASELHNHTCVLETGKRQPEAIRLYKKAGYQQIQNYGQYKNIANSICMEKQL